MTAVDTTPAQDDRERRAIYGMSHPAAAGEVVKQGHADYCRDYGHATYTIDGVDQGWCPRCGEITAEITAEASTMVPAEPDLTYDERSARLLERWTQHEAAGRRTEHAREQVEILEEQLRRARVHLDECTTEETGWLERVHDDARATGRCPACTSLLTEHDEECGLAQGHRR